MQTIQPSHTNPLSAARTDVPSRWQRRSRVSRCSPRAAAPPRPPVRTRLVGELHDRSVQVLQLHAQPRVAELPGPDDDRPQRSASRVPNGNDPGRSIPGVQERTERLPRDPAPADQRQPDPARTAATNTRTAPTRVRDMPSQSRHPRLPGSNQPRATNPRDGQRRGSRPARTDRPHRREDLPHDQGRRDHRRRRATRPHQHTMRTAHEREAARNVRRRHKQRSPAARSSAERWDHLGREPLELLRVLDERVEQNQLRAGVRHRTDAGGALLGRPREGVF